MRYLSFLSIIVLLLITGCTVPDEAHVQVPDSLTVMSKDSFKLFLLDMHLSDAYLSTLSIDELKDSVVNAENLYGSLFKKYHITNSIFQQTLLYYSYHLTEYDSIYTEILNELNLRKDSLQYKVKKTTLK